ncbi:LPP20 family lipoprotein [Helicobacter sp. MIT 14-3879]|uniref:LPP20 family lipoprotein n=1 Tax=Helicobacter sp. MIT 14-3879 TaxID=2040649 RepID=UPI000E1EDAF5|nr:LPP20 family lipoprotein [Helicobacter sp. MIT 14-3879]RDU65465.1 hypothetical protein CQA44_00280 [Helicobacter sp. MIT 14-3879]
MIKKKLFFLIILFTIIACSSNPKIQYPEWYLNTPSNTNYIYGIGEGDNLKEAKIMAIEDIASKISLNIESSLEIEKKAIDSNISNKINSNIGISVDDIQLDNVEYINTEEINNRFFTQAKIKKELLTKKFNADIQKQIISIKNIINDIKTLGCNTYSPKEQYKLNELYSKANQKAKYILALEGNVVEKNILKNTKEILSQSSNAYYVSFAKNGNSNKYKDIDNALMSEYKKFFNITSKDETIYYIENIYYINNNELNLIINIKDCNGNVVFNTNLKDKNKNLTSAINRIKAQLYKKLSTWIKE